MASETTFFSYSRNDSAFVLKLAKDLREAGAKIWLDQLDIKPGSHWDASIEAALNTSSNLIVILSSSSVASNNVMDEVSFALENNKNVIPVLLSDCNTPFRLKRLQRIDFTSDYQSGLDQLLEVLGHPIDKGIANKTVEVQVQDQKKDQENLSAKKYSEEEADNKLWEEAKRINSVSSYNKYLSETAIGLFKEKAQQVINRLEAERKQHETFAITERSQSPKVENKGISKKYFLIGAGVLLVAVTIWAITRSGSSATNPATLATTTNQTQDSIRLGNYFQGGIIFYLDSTMQHGLIAQKEDLGEFNEKDAIEKCDALGNGWRLPSSGEIIMLYANKNIVGGFVNDAQYWYSVKNSNGDVTLYLYYIDKGVEGWATGDNITALVRLIKDF